MSEETDWSCVVCCQYVNKTTKKSIYAIGSCDHLVCYECSTRMRVLCKQNECAICRQDMPKVVFTRSRHKKFEEFDLSKCVYFNNYGIYFEDEVSLDSYGRLLEHPCRLCKKRLPFKNLTELKTHLRKEHELYFCELCVDNLKVFSSERKYYTRKELARHGKSGDPEETCHRGHPLCHFCEVRYVDEDELQAHLRREHFYCHFCDPSGLSQFYGDYDDLKRHFIREHFLCRECDSHDEKFTNAFRSEIDLQAHIASAHSQNMSKMDLKKARTLSLGLFITQRSGQMPINADRERRKKEQRSRPSNDDDNNFFTEEYLARMAAPTQPPRPEDFPQLCAAGAGATSSANSNNNENTTTNSKPNRKQNSFSVCLNKNSKLNTRNDEDFPALPGAHSSGANDSRHNNNSKPPAKPHGMSYNGLNQTPVSVKINNQNKSNNVKPSLSTKLGSSKSEANKIKIDNSEEFPSLPVNTKKNKSRSGSNSATNSSSKSMTASQSGKHANKNDIPSSNWINGLSLNNAVRDTIIKETDTKENTNKVKKVTSIEEFPVLEACKSNAPPGLPPLLNKLSIVAPPGMNSPRKKTSLSLSSVAQEVVCAPTQQNSLNDDNSKEHYFLNPVNFNDRNHSLVTEIENVLKDHSNFNLFKHSSKEFRQGMITAIDYYKNCNDIFGKKDFDSIFPELLALLPDIQKQNELYAVYQNQLKLSKGAIPKRSGSSIVYDHNKYNDNQFVICPRCQQVLIIKDGANHMSMH